MKVITAVVNNLHFIEIQYYTLKKYFKGEYEFIVFNDAKSFPDYTNYNDITIKNRIEELCKKLNIKCINIPNEHHEKTKNKKYIACQRTADSMNFILEYQKKNPDKYLLLDSDMFLIDYFDPNKYEKYDISIVLQTRDNEKIKYIWNGLYYFNFLKLKNTNLIDWNLARLCDVGGATQDWLKTIEQDNIYFIKHLWSCNWNKDDLPKNIKDQKLINFFENDPRNVNDKYFCEIYDNIFLHYRAGGNWRKESYELHNSLSLKLKNILLNQ